MNKKLYFGIVTACLISFIVGAGFVYLVSAQTASTFWITEGVYPNPATYTISREGSYYFAKNAYGQIPTGCMGTNASEVVNNALALYTSAGGSMYFLEADYVIRGRINYNEEVSNIHFKGANRESTRLILSIPDINQFNYGYVLYLWHNSSLSDLTIDGSFSSMTGTESATAGGAIGIGGNNNDIVRVNAGNLNYYVTYTHSNYTTYRDCLFYGGSRSDFFSFADAHDNKMLNCIFDESIVDTSLSPLGTYGGTFYPVRGSNLLVDGCTFFQPVHFNAGNGTRFINNLVQGNRSTVTFSGFVSHAPSTGQYHTIINGNTFNNTYSNSYAVIFQGASGGDYSQYATISDNEIYSVNGHGIGVYYARYVKTCDNLINTVPLTLKAIRVYGSTNCTFENNLIQNAQYGIYEEAGSDYNVIDTNFFFDVTTPITNASNTILNDNVGA